MGPGGRIIEAESKRWQAPAAYLYILRLNEPQIAWEYLRRNSDYRADWDRRHDNDTSDPISRWHIETLEDPSADARVAHPVWCVERDSRVKLQAADESGEADDTERFSLWSIPGPKRLVHDGKHVLLTSFAASEQLRLALGRDVRDGVPFEYVLKPSPHADKTWRVFSKHWGSAPETSNRRAFASARPNRIALLHMRALQALDGSGAGASQREIARHVFGEEAIAKNWHPDSELRAQVRHLVRRARALVAGGYRSLIDQ
jgi:hypothetical protein